MQSFAATLSAPFHCIDSLYTRGAAPARFIAGPVLEVMPPFQWSPFYPACIWVH